MSTLYRTMAVLVLLSATALAGPPAPGIENFYQVDENVYRGAQPTSRGLEYLAKIGVKTVLDLREKGERGAREEARAKALGMQYVNVPMSGLTPPTTGEITRILVLLENPTPGPVFVHCMRGADRTGAVIAAYRIDHDHWENARALDEAMGFGMSFFQFPRQNFIRKFQPLPSIEAPPTTMAPPAKDSTVQPSHANAG